MGKLDNEAPSLMQAAGALEAELAKLEAISKSVRKLRLTSEKSIARAAKELSEALELPERLGQGLQALASAMAQMQARQQAAIEPLSAFASEIQRRMQRLSEHMQAFAELGKAAGEVTALIQNAGGERGAVVGEVQAQLERISEGARSLSDAAQSDDFPDVAREADLLKQRTAALRKRLLTEIN